MVRECIYFLIIQQTGHMTHKAKCIQHCKDFLAEKNLSQHFNTADFNHIYRKFNGYECNAYSIGLDAADFIIINAKPQPLS